MDNLANSSGPSARRPERLFIYVACALIVLGVFLAYSRSLNVPFLLDDSYNILENKSIKSLWPPYRPFLPPTRTGLAGRPLSNFTFAVNHAISGQNTSSYHAVNILIHALAALFLFGAVHRLLQTDRLRSRFETHATWIAFLSALIWALHPMQTMAVTYISQRMESLMGCLFLACVYCALRGWQKNAFWPWHALAVAAFAAGTGAKEVIVAAPFLILAMDLVLVHPGLGRALSASARLYAGLAAGLALLALIVLTGGQEQSGISETPPLAYLITQTQVIVHYLSLAFWPRSLCFDYAWPIATLGQALPHALFLTVLLALTAWGLFKRHPLALAGVWFFLTLAPSSSIRPLPEVVDEYRMYLPLAALVPALVILSFAGISRLLGKTGMAAGALVALALAALLGVLSYQRNAVYQTAFSLWTDTLAKQPRNARAHNNLGRVLADMGKWSEAVAHYEKALQLKADFPKAEANLGAALAHTGKNQEAVAHLESALKKKPDLAEGYYNLAEVLLGMGQTSRALDQYQKAIVSKPDFAWAHLNLGVALLKAGKATDAETHFRQAIAIDPGFAKAHFDLANTLLETQRVQEAVSHYKTAVLLDPGFAQAHANLGVALMNTGDPIEATAQFQKAVELDPSLAEARFNLARALAAAGNWEQALVQFQKTAQSAPSMPLAHAGLAAAQARTGRFAEAAASFEKALALDSNQAQWHFQLARLYQKLGRPADSLARLQAAVALSPSFFKAVNDLGLAYMKANELDKAGAAFLKAMSIEPDSPAPYYNMACVSAKKNQPLPAVQWLEKAAAHGFTDQRLMETDPDLASIRGSAAFKSFILKTGARTQSAKDQNNVS